jgi:hypothetical protein
MPRDKTSQSLLSPVEHAIEFRSGALADQRACLVETCRNACHGSTNALPRLEDHLETELCARGSHGTELTPAGRAVRARFR